MKQNKTVTVAGTVPQMTREEVIAFVARYNPETTFRLVHKSIVPAVEVGKPNVELFDDPSHNGQYWGG